ncbi:hypothetical protein COO60DRAFT_937688 [Scenedesmus sp. NREL 46B-D3]|nr:hypothetical protein COO60DRAFT_937688 [Scenedesmus sp. NREL 46B-D3]
MGSGLVTSCEHTEHDAQLGLRHAACTAALLQRRSAGLTRPKPPSLIVWVRRAPGTRMPAGSVRLMHLLRMTHTCLPLNKPNKPCHAAHHAACPTHGAGHPSRCAPAAMLGRYGGGRAGLSDTMAGTFWVLDALCELGKAGAAGLLFHWGLGGAEDGTMGSPNTGVQTNFFYKVGGKRLEYKELKSRGLSPDNLPAAVAWPSIHAPWYAYLAWTCFAHGGYNKLADTTFVRARVDSQEFCKANLKIHALRANNGELRIMLLNKDAQRNCNARIKVPGQYCKTSALTRLLPGPQGMRSKGGISWQGQTYHNAGHEGEIKGQKEVQWVDRKTFKDGRCGFEIAMPAATAALIVSKA